MESAANYGSHGDTKLRLFTGSSSYQDHDIVELSSDAACVSVRQNRKRMKAVPCDIIEIDEDDDRVMVIGENNLFQKNKQPVKSKYSSKRNNKETKDEAIEDEIDIKFRTFKQFDTIHNHSDHHFIAPERHTHAYGVAGQASKSWTKKVQNDWKILQEDLPDNIFVRAYEERMDLLRAVIVGPAGTPYHDGLFFFDIHFPPNYPQSPPLVHYHSGGLRLNPNLYHCGKVCLSLLNTWSGHGCEKWSPSNSTILQVLVSIQALVLNAKPYFNEPGYAYSANTPAGEKHSQDYNEQVFLLSCRTMLYSMRRPPKHFEDFVTGHFRKHGRAILVSCKAYMDGAQVGCLVGEGVQDVDEGDKSCSSSFKTSVKQIYGELQKELISKGVSPPQVSPPQESDQLSLELKLF